MLQLRILHCEYESVRTLFIIQYMPHARKCPTSNEHKYLWPEMLCTRHKLDSTILVNRSSGETMKTLGQTTI
jgi:hypothetical protein